MSKRKVSKDVVADKEILKEKEEMCYFISSKSIKIFKSGFYFLSPVAALCSAAVQSMLMALFSIFR